MPEACKKIKYKKKRSSGPILKKNALKKRLSDDIKEATTASSSRLSKGETDFEENVVFAPPKNTFEELRNWVRKQMFIPQELSDEFLTVFLSGVGYDVEAAADRLLKYFYSRQEPSCLFRDRDTLSPKNLELFKNHYVLPMPDTSDCGAKVILMGLLKPVATYNPTDHAKLLAMVLDLLIWEKDFGFGDFIVVFDGRNFTCPQLLERKVNNHRSITSLLLDTIPGSLRSFYLLYPPPHVTSVADSRNELWITVVKSKQQMIGYLPADILPLEFGGNLGHLEDLLEQWHQHLAQSRNFFIHFERKMIDDYRRRTCYEREVARRGRSWVHNMKLVADEWEYKIQYYEKMRNFRPLRHPGFGKDGEMKRKQHKLTKRIDPLAKCKKLLRQEKLDNLLFEPTYLYHGYASEIRKAQMEESKAKDVQKCPSVQQETIQLKIVNL